MGVVFVIGGATDIVESRLSREAEELSVLTNTKRESGVGSTQEISSVGSHPLVNDGHTPVAVVTLFFIAGGIPDQTFHHLLKSHLICERERERERERGREGGRERERERDGDYIPQALTQPHESI